SSVSTAETVTLTASAGSVAKTFALQLGAAVPTLAINATTIAFGDVVLNTPATQSVTLTSAGTAAVTVSAATVSGSGFTVSGAAFPLTLNPNQTATLTARFDPTTAGAASGSLTITSNSSTGTSTVVGLSGTGTTVSALTCSGGSMAGSGTDACTVALNAAAPSGGLAVSLSSNSTAVTVPATVTVPANATTANYTATVAAVATNQTVTLTASAGGVSQNFALLLNATSSVITRNAHGVTDVGATTTASPITVSLTNVAAGDLIVCEVTLESGVTLTSVSDPSNGVYSPAIAFHTNSTMTQQIGIYFVANAVAGSYPVSVVWTGGATNYQAMACQSWTGVAASSPQDTTMMQQQDNSSTPNPTSGSTLTPAAAGELVIGNLITSTHVPAAGANYAFTDSATVTYLWPEYWIQTTATATNSPYTSSSDNWTDQTVAFKPASSGSAAPAPAPAITSAASAAGTVNSGFSYQITATNTPTSYGATGLPPGLTVNTGTGLVSGTPTTAGTSIVTLSATNGGGTGSATLTLTISAAAPALSINATSVAFGDVALNTPATQSVTLTSTGTAAVIVNAATATGTGFTVSGATFPLTLSPNQTATLSVEFDPTSAGAVSGSLTITSNSSTGTSDAVSLSGTGVLLEVNLTWDAPSGSPDPVAGYNVYRSPSGATAYQQLNTSAITQTTYVDTTIQAGQTYDYIVESVDASGVTSAPSNMASVTTP
ncbi:MAG: choice-of-anchor D domain-containing protein, partial [Terracidiphilus sp.]